MLHLWCPIWEHVEFFGFFNRESPWQERQGIVGLKRDQIYTSFGGSLLKVKKMTKKLVQVGVSLIIFLAKEYKKSNV